MIESTAELKLAYEALRQVVEEHADAETLKGRFEEVYHEMRLNRAAVLREADSRIPVIHMEML